MYTLNELDYKKIKQYKKDKNQNVAIYFYEKFSKDLSDIIFYKINKKFSSVPFEKGDMFHLVWNSIKKTLSEYKKGQNFNIVLLSNCYYLTIKEIKKFLNNSELILNTSGSFERYTQEIRRHLDVNNIVNIEIPREIILKDIIKLACENLNKFTQPTIKRVIYLKSQGYSVSQISKKLRIGRYKIDELLKLTENIVKKMY